MTKMITLQLSEDEYEKLILIKAVYSFVKESIYSDDEERLIQEAIRYLHTKYSREELINRIAVHSTPKNIEPGGEKIVC